MPEEKILLDPNFRRGMSILETYIETVEDLLRFWRVFSYKET